MRQWLAHVTKHLGLPHPLAQALGHGQCHLVAGVRQQHHHFLAAVAHREVGRPQRAAQHLRRRAQRFVAGQVPMGVVELLEVVQVDHDQRQRRVGTVRGGHHGRQQVVEPGAVVQARQAVDHRQLAVELAQFLAAPQLRVGRADAERQQPQQVARQDVGFINQLPHQVGLDHQHLALLQRRDARQVGLLIQHRLLADAFAGQDLADGAIGHAGARVAGHRQRAA
ncbi:conserved hypothetical protein [Ricinus communis]|uniref:Uncharacterized protein n=1 Tax=Ricinus communis TaxID=3988 RepID=B9TBC4_RICCO|nr:conserved hypothetical protein [Ricinus communis]